MLVRLSLFGGLSTYRSCSGAYLSQLQGEVCTSLARLPKQARHPRLLVESDPYRNEKTTKFDILVARMSPGHSVNCNLHVPHRLIAEDRAVEPWASPQQTVLAIALALVTAALFSTGWLCMKDLCNQ